MPLLWKIAVSVVSGASVMYAGAVALLWWKQSSLIYPAPADDKSGTSTPDVGSHLVWLKTADGVDLKAIYRPARSGLPTVIFFHGNGDTLNGSQQATRALSAQGYGLLLPEYRGYGGNEGMPNETGLYQDGEAALLWLSSRDIPADQTIIIGNSLGSGVATEIAASHHVGGLILVSGFTSLPDVVQSHLPYVPVHRLVHDRYDNVRKIARVQCPVLILHGSADSLINAKHAAALADARPGASLQLVPGCGHELVYTEQSQNRITAWLCHLPHGASGP